MLDVDDIWDDEHYSEYERVQSPAASRPIKGPLEVYYQKEFEVPFLDKLPPERLHIPAVTYHHDSVVKELKDEVERAYARAQNASLLARSALDANQNLHDDLANARADALQEAAMVCQRYVYETDSATAQYVLGCVREVLLKMVNEDV